MTPDSTAWDSNAEAYPPLTDQDLRRRERLKALFLAHYAPLYTFARSCGTHEPADAKDAIQITFHRLLKKRGDLLDDPVAPATQATQAAELKQYLYSSVRGRMLNGIRNENIHDRILTTLAPTLHPPPCVPRPP
ncbi:MAG TPA: hypothetical protein VNU46_00230 [Gemmatimonadaceae bacterium]|jgi:DNA-directed RNA polymerase specialized sigma24 family protein|nr:hypothetical protein [Gemmatimonadaceae bacterium]